MCLAWVIVNTQKPVTIMIIIIFLSINSSVEVLLKNDFFSTNHFGLDLKQVKKQSQAYL